MKNLARLMRQEVDGSLTYAIAVGGFTPVIAGPESMPKDVQQFAGSGWSTYDSGGQTALLLPSAGTYLLIANVHSYLQCFNTNLTRAFGRFYDGSNPLADQGGQLQDSGWDGWLLNCNQQINLGARTQYFLTTFSWIGTLNSSQLLIYLQTMITDGGSNTAILELADTSWLQGVKLSDRN